MSDMATTCQICEKTFYARPCRVKSGEAKYCSKECRIIKTRTGRYSQNCEICGKTFVSSPCLHKTGKGRYCSNKCRLIARIKTVSKKCAYCGKEYLIKPSKLKSSKYCSKKCKDNSLIGKNASEITRLKMSEQRIGDKHPQWKGGTNREPYGKGFNSITKEKIRIRDEFTCQECGYKEEQLKYKLHIHHIDYNKQNNDINNLIALCNSCHVKTNWNRDDWEKYYRDKRRNSPWVSLPSL